MDFVMAGMLWAGFFFPSALRSQTPVITGIQKTPKITVQSRIGLTNAVLYADDLATGAWKVLTNIVVTQSPYDVADFEASSVVKRYYEVQVTGYDQRPTIPNMIYIFPGTFVMGSPLDELWRDSYEGPQTTVTITRGFWIGRYEVTQQEYQDVMNENPSQFTGDLRRPVEWVSWHDATNYCGKLTAQEAASGRLPAGFIYRLPSEAEWEFTCRAGATTATAFGSSLSSTQANINGDHPYNGGTTGPNLAATTTVGSYAPNAWGLHDTHGNVWEWCLDWYAAYPGGSVDDPHGPDSGTVRVNRGGSWFRYGRDSRASFRHDVNPNARTSDIGFRIVLAPDQR